GWRSYFRSTRAHNTVTVDGRSQSEMGGPFLWTRHAGTIVERWRSSPVLDLVRASQNGYERWGVTHRRTVIYCKPDTWVIVDELTGTGEHAIEQRFHLAPGTIEASPGALRVCGTEVTLLAAPVSGVRCRVALGSEEPREGWRS